MKTRPIIAALALVVGLVSCRTTVPTPVYVVHVRGQGSTPIQISAVDTLEVDWNPENASLHFPDEADMTFDGGVADGIMTHITGTSGSGGDFIVDYPASYVVANATMGTTGFDIDLPFYAREPDAGVASDPPILITVRVLDPTRTQIASGAAHPEWPLVGGMGVQVAVLCDMGHETACNPP